MVERSFLASQASAVVSVVSPSSQLQTCRQEITLTDADIKEHTKSCQCVMGGAYFDPWITITIGLIDTLLKQIKKNLSIPFGIDRIGFDLT